VDGIEPEILAGAEKTLPFVKSILIEVEGENADNVEKLIDAPLAKANFHEDINARLSGSGRNRIYRKT